MTWIYDIETYPNVFTFVFKQVFCRERNLKIFEISSRKNDKRELISFLKTDLLLVGYNNLEFDYPILHFILENPNCTIEELYNESQRIINSEFSSVPQWKVKIPQCDLLKINHYDNQARRTSLKWLEFTLRWHKLQDLPFEPGTIIPEDKIDELILYNINDVESTEKFFYLCKDSIIFREQMSKVLNHDVMGYSDVKIGEYLNRITYSELSGVPYQNFKSLQTERSIIPIKDLIPDWVSFKTKPFQDFLNQIKSESIDANSKGDWEKYISIGNMNIKFAKGGLHSDDSPGITKCKEGYFLKEKDVGSMYPKAIIAGNYYPEHLGQAWNQGIKKLYDERADELKPQLKKLKKGSPEYTFIDSKQNAYKLAMNGGGYGKTGSDFGWQKDKLVMFKVTFRGQLSLLMLLEEYYLLGNVDLISANTDGIVIHYPKEIDDKVQEIHNRWETMTDSILEDTFYKQIINRDVNNYIAEITDSDGNSLYFKYKGCFEIDPDFHKNNSQRIVPIALKEYFINNVPVREVIKNIGYEFENSKGKKEKTTIFDYCKGVKKSSGTKGYAIINIAGRQDITDKVIRFYISNSGTKLYKIYEKKDKEGNERIEAVSKGFNITSFMNYEEKDDYNIDYNYYINECNKIIKIIERETKKQEMGYIEPEQLKLF